MRFEKKRSEGMESVVQAYIRAMKLSPALNKRRIFAAWNQATEAGQYTIRQSYRDGRLTVTLNSSVVRSMLYMQRDIFVKRINEILDRDELFNSDDPNVGFVKEIVLK